MSTRNNVPCANVINTDGKWIVEVINYSGEGEITWAHFYGNGAERHARAYSEWFNSTKPLLREQYQHTLSV